MSVASGQEELPTHVSGSDPHCIEGRGVHHQPSPQPHHRQSWETCPSLPSKSRVIFASSEIMLGMSFTTGNVGFDTCPSILNRESFRTFHELSEIFSDENNHSLSRELLIKVGGVNAPGQLLVSIRSKPASHIAWSVARWDSIGPTSL